MSRRRFVARLAALALAASPGPRATFAAASPAAAKPTAAMALRVAALTERVLKLHGQVGANVLAARARRSLGPALRDLEASVHALGMPAPASELHERVAILAILAGQYRGIALQPPGRDRAAALAERADEIEWEAQRIAALLEPAGAPRDAAARAEEAAGNAERIARLLLWRRWGIAGAADAQRLATAKHALQADIDALREVRRDGAVEAELQVAENQVAFLFAAAGRIDGEAGPGELEYAVKASDNARESLERLAALYGRSV